MDWILDLYPSNSASSGGSATNNATLIKFLKLFINIYLFLKTVFCTIMFQP